MITRIEKETTSDRRYLIYVEGQPPFSIHEEVLVKLHLHKGMSINLLQLEQVLEEEEKSRIRQASYRYLSYKPRTIFEVRKYLLQKEENEKYIEHVIADMIKRGYLNDQQYAEKWVRDKKRNKGWGYFRLKQELEKKGIEARWIEEALDVDKETERELAMHKANKRYLRFCNDPWIKVERKIGSYLLREGFSREIIYSILNELRLTHGEKEESERF